MGFAMNKQLLQESFPENEELDTLSLHNFIYFIFRDRNFTFIKELRN